MNKMTNQVLKQLGISRLAERRIGEMSSGEARRILIGRALIHDPEALVLDEPTNSLDWRASLGFRETLKKVAAHGTTLILVTHQLEDLIPEIKRVILMKKGRVFKDGSLTRVMIPAHIRALFGPRVRLCRSRGQYRLL
jgi:iron complex transport system ATP-binding protein